MELLPSFGAPTPGGAAPEGPARAVPTGGRYGKRRDEERPCKDKADLDGLRRIRPSPDAE